MQKSAASNRPQSPVFYFLDYLIKLRVRDMEAYREFASKRLWQFPGVRETRTYAVIEEVKDGGPLPI